MSHRQHVLDKHDRDIRHAAIDNTLWTNMTVTHSRIYTIFFTRCLIVQELIKHKLENLETYQILFKLHGSNKCKLQSSFRVYVQPKITNTPLPLVNKIYPKPYYDLELPLRLRRMHIRTRPHMNQVRNLSLQASNS